MFSGDLCSDVQEIRQLFRNLFAGHGATVDCVPDNPDLTETTVSYCYIDSEQFGGIDAAGAFKKAAIFTKVVKEIKPVQEPLPDKFFQRFRSLSPEQIAFFKQPGFLNTIVAFECARYLLHKARINYSTTETEEPEIRELGNPILVSEHTWCDVIIALEGNGNVRDVAIIYELLAYKDNPGASYPATI